jgi:hypothetical protein
MKNYKKYQCGVVILAVIAVLATLAAPASASPETEENIRAMMNVANAELEAVGEPVRVGAIEYYTAFGEVGQIVYFNDRTKQSESHWVPGDPRRGGRYNITWSSDLVDGAANGLTQAETQAELSGAMNIWSNMGCGETPLVMQLSPDMDWGYYQSIWTWCCGGYGGGDPSIYFDMDITHAGWLPGAFFAAIGAPPTAIGVSVTFYFLDDVTGEPTDIDNNRKFDTAFVEIYYNNAFDWGIGTDWPLDVKTVVLHETGHALSIGHFGRLFDTNKNGKRHFAPRAVMNAGYAGQLDITGTDIASYCSIWAAWPGE